MKEDYREYSGGEDFKLVCDLIDGSWKIADSDVLYVARKVRSVTKSQRAPKLRLTSRLF